MRRNLFRNILGGLSFTTALFIFQACYGTPQDFGLDVLIEGQVKSRATGLPIKGIKVAVVDGIQYTSTNDEGRFGFYTERAEQLRISFIDIDSEENGVFSTKDTLLVNFPDAIYLDILLDSN
jgi:hypothetical protein